ncbi:MAG TPA: histidine kinase dimerization/phospho-acceptor domain-containing protein [Gaiellales bacterium]|nr:histidine kinase dimerization/phospho-acceptor domain-containing protein [Gaiellales bacterium]
MGHTEGPDLAHRLRTPLAVIVGYIEILALRDRDGENAEILDHLREAAADLGTEIDAVVAADSTSHTVHGEEGGR